MKIEALTIQPTFRNLLLGVIDIWRSDLMASEDIGGSPLLIESENSLIAIKEEMEEDIWLNALKEIREYGALDSGWDGYGACSFDPLVLQRASQIVRIVKKVSDESGVELSFVEPGPAGDGSIDVELRKEKKSLIITIYPPQENKLAAYFEDEETEKEETGIYESRFVYRWLHRFFSEDGVPFAFSTARSNTWSRETLASGL